MHLVGLLIHTLQHDARCIQRQTYYCCKFRIQVNIILYAFLVFLDAVAKFRKATIIFVMSVRLSVVPHVTIRLPLDGF